MGISFSANEVFEMAEQMEVNGMRFYRHVAERADDEPTRRLLLDLAAMEEQHKQTFADMQKQLSEAERAGTVFDPEGESALYLRAFVEGVAFSPQADPVAALSGRESMDEILAVAIALEKDTIAFYVGIRDLVPPRLGRSRVEQIIREEKGHVVILSHKRTELKV